MHIVAYKVDQCFAIEWHEPWPIAARLEQARNETLSNSPKGALHCNTAIDWDAANQWHCWQSSPIQR